MKRKTKTAVTYCGILVGMILFTVTAFAAVEQVSGYEALKSAAADTVLQKNFTCKISGEANLNQGQEADIFEMIFRLDGKKFHLTEYSNGSFSQEIFEDQSRQLFRYSPEKTFAESQYTHPVSDSITFDKVRLAEVFLDLMMGEAKNEVVAEGNKVSLHLNRQQIPAVLQLAATVMAESMQMEFGLPEGPELTLEDFLQLNQITIEEITGEGEVDSQGALSSVQVEIKISGKTADGRIHTVDMTLAAQFDGVGSTTVELPEEG